MFFVFKSFKLFNLQDVVRYADDTMELMDESESHTQKIYKRGIALNNNITEIIVISNDSKNILSSSAITLLLLIIFFFLIPW